MLSRCSSALLLKMIPVISLWKYAGACVSPKGTLMYLYLPNGEVRTVLGMDASSQEIWWHPAQRSNVEEYFTPFS